jgi:hypothetical protein
MPMRLSNVESGHGLRAKLILAMIRVVGRRKPPSVVRTGLYRPQLFGRPFSVLLENVMRGPSEWSVGERELMAAFVSRMNQCVF